MIGMGAMLTRMQAKALDGLGQFEAAGRAYMQAWQQVCDAVPDTQDCPSEEMTTFMGQMLQGTKDVLREDAEDAFAKAWPDKEHIIQLYDRNGNPKWCGFTAEELQQLRLSNPGFMTCDASRM